jgi:2-dehydropantoate 2-reductase
MNKEFFGIFNMSESESVVVWGAGAIGGVIAACLARANINTIAVDASSEHVQAIQEHGLTISGPVLQLNQAMPAFTPDQVTDVYNTIFLAVKAQHTETAIQQLLPHLAPNGTVVSLQNGLNEVRIAELIGEQRSVCGFVNFAADYIEPGHILYGNAGALKIGEHQPIMTPRLRHLEQMLQHYHADVRAVDDIWAYKWGKLAYGSLLFLTAVSDDTIADSVGNPAFETAFTALVREVIEVAVALGVTPHGFDGFEPTAFLSDAPAGAARASLDAIARHYRHSPKARSGVYRDLAVRRRKTEIDSQIGEIPRAAARIEMTTPVTDLLIQYIRGIENGERIMGHANLVSFNQEVSSL